MYLNIILFCSIIIISQQKLNGFNFLNGQWGLNKYNSQQAKFSLDSLINQTNSNTIALTFCHYQLTVDEPGPIYARKNITPTDLELQSIIQYAQSKNMSVMLRPCVDPDWSNPKTNGTWRGQIGRNFSSEEWKQWFSYYNQLILYYASFAQQMKIGFYQVGMELETAALQNDYFKLLIKQVREIYKGNITYGSNHGMENLIQFWQELDYIAIDAYYPLAINDLGVAPVADLIQSWTPIVENFKNLSLFYNKKIIFTEIGYQSLVGSHYFYAHPKQSTLSYQEQINDFTAFFEYVYNQEFFEGIYIWDWLTSDNGNNTDFTIDGKPAAGIIKRYFSEVQKF